MDKQRKKRLRDNDRKYTNSISSKKSKKSNKQDRDQVIEAVPALPTLPVINNVDLYAGEKKNSPWSYQQQEQQNSFYYDSQPMTPLESSYSLQKNPTNKFNPYSETPRIQQQNSVYQPAKAYTQQDNTSNYYHSPQQQLQHQYSATSTAYNTPTTTQSFKNIHSYDSSTAVMTTDRNKPHTHNDYSSVDSHTQITNGGYSQASYDNHSVTKSPSQYHQNAYYQQSYEELPTARTMNTSHQDIQDDYFQNYSVPPPKQQQQQSYSNYI